MKYNQTRQSERRKPVTTVPVMAVKRRIQDAIENLKNLEAVGLSRRIAVIVSARQFGLTAEKLTEMLNGK